jgi:hypothetical protein
VLVSVTVSAAFFLQFYFSLCRGCVCCQVQIDPCYIPRVFLHLICCCIPCGCIAEETIITACCCNPGKATEDPFERQKKIDKAVNQKVATHEK